MDHTATFYSRPSYVGGAGPIFTGARRQRGGSVLGAIKSIVSPLLSGVGNSIKKNAMNNALGLATDVVGDMFSGKNVKSSLLNRAKERGLRALKQTFADVMPVRRKRKPVKRMKKRVVGKKQRGSGRKTRKARKPSRKRRASHKSSSKAKRRRLNY